MDDFDVTKAIAEAVLRADAESPRPPAAPAPTPLEVRAAHGARRLEFALSNGNRAMIAEAYALLGEYEKAVTFAEGETLREYEKILAAIHGNKCDCPTFDGHGAKKHPNRFVREQFIRHSNPVDLYYCLRCGTYSI